MRLAVLLMTGVTVLAQVRTEGLLVSGRVAGGKVHLGPAFAAPMPGRAPSPAGPFLLEGRDAKGRVLFQVPFQAVEVADLPTQEAGFTVRADLAAETLRALRILRVTEQGQELDRRTSTGPLPGLKAQARRTGAQVVLTWNRPYRFVLVRRPGTGEILAAGQGQDLTLAADAESLEVIASDGVRSARATVTVR